MDRTYYGMNVGQPGGYTKEVGLGANVYVANIPTDNLYDYQNDPDGLREELRGITDRNEAYSRYESLIQAAGYSGYTIQHPSMGEVAAVYEKMAVEPFTQVPEEAEVKFSPRTKPDPVKTVKAYKLLKMKKSKPGQVFPLFIGATVPTEMGKWLDADFIPTKGFAPRPGWHFGYLPIAPHLMKKDGTMPKDRVWVEVEIGADKDWQAEAEKQGGDIKGEIPEDGYYTYPRPMSQGGQWMIAGTMKINRVLNDTEVAGILEANGLTPPVREGGTLYMENYGFPSGDVVAPLSKAKFFSQYAQHVDVRNRGTDKAEEVSRSILSDGFKKGINVNALPPYRGGEPFNIVEKRYAPKAGDYVYLAPKTAWKDKANGMEIQDGWIPKPYEVIKVTKDYPDMYEEYLKAVENYNSSRATPDIRFSLPEGETWFEPEPTFEAPLEVSMKDRFMTAIVDKFHSLTKTQKKIGAVEEYEDVDTAVTRYPGMSRARLDDFEIAHQQQLLNIVDKSGLSFEAAAEYLHARHAREANEVLQRRNPDREDNQALSGMTNEKADEILAKYAGNAAVQQIGTKVDQIQTERLRELVEDELLTQEEADAWAENYKHYVPLHRSDVGNGDLPRRGSGFDVRGKVSQLRAGSTREVDYENMFAHILAQNEVMIVKAEKNKVAQTMYNLAVNHPNPDMWTTNEQLMTQKAYLKADGTVGYRPDYATPNSPTLVAKFNGENKYVQFNTENKHALQIMSAMKNMDSQSTNVITRALLNFNRYLSSINTSLSPEFVISNFFRDAQTAFYNLTDTEAKDLEMKIMKGIPGAMRGIHSSLRGEGNHEWSPWFDEFRHEGGMTGWMQAYDDVQDRMKAVKRSLKWDKHMGLRQIKGIMKTISDYNMVVENAVRLSSYRNAREAGLSKAKAARIAKEVTVNFNRRGEWAMTANALYLFYNASVQGSARLLRAVANPKNHRLHKMVAGTIAVAALLDIVNRLAGEDDDDEKSKYDVIRAKYGERNLIIMDWFGVTDDKEGIFLKIPLPWGYNVFHILGQEIGQAVSHSMGDYPEYSAWESTGRLAGSVLESFNPTQDGSLLQTLSPTILDPLVRVSENKDWHGGPLYPNYNKSADNYTKFYSGARQSSRNIAEWLAETFRDEETTKIPQLLDISPEWIDMAFDFTTGALGRFAADTGTMTRKLMQGEAWEYKEIPIVRKLVGNVAPSDIKMEFYESYYTILDMDSRIRKQITDGNPEKAKAMRLGVGNRLKMVPMAKLTKKKLRKIKKQMNNAKRLGNDEQMKVLEKHQLRIMNQYLKRYRNVIYNQ